jgi:DNA-binding NarL/FixJ family response regulator
MTTHLSRALVVDDNESWQQVIKEILSDCGLEVDVAGNLEEAIVCLKAQTHRLAIVDLSLSPNDHNNHDGLLVLDSVNRLDPNCHTILLTGFATVELAVSALTDYGAFTFLRKENFNRNRFRDTIQQILVSPPHLDSPLPASGTKHPAHPDNGYAIPEKHPVEKAIVVEDDAGWRSILEELLIEAGFQVFSCAGFGEAFGYLRRDNFALAVIDLSLHESSSFDTKGFKGQNLVGYQLLQTSRAKGIPTIVVSGVSEVDEIQRIYADYGVAAFIEKQAFERSTFLRLAAEVSSHQVVVNEISALTEREREVLDLLAQGLTNKEIAEKLFITINTVKRHLKAIFEKLNVHTRSAATAKVAGGQ